MFGSLWIVAAGSRALPCSDKRARGRPLAGICVNTMDAIDWHKLGQIGAYVVVSVGMVRRTQLGQRRCSSSMT